MVKIDYIPKIKKKHLFSRLNANLVKLRKPSTKSRLFAQIKLC